MLRMSAGACLCRCNAACVTRCNKEPHCLMRLYAAMSAALHHIALNAEQEWECALAPWHVGDQSPGARQRHKESGGLMFSLKSFLLASCATALMSSAAWAADPIKIGVIAEAQAVAGSSIAP